MLQISKLSLLLCLLLVFPVFAEKSAPPDGVSGTNALESSVTKTGEARNIEPGGDRWQNPDRDQPAIVVEPNAIELELYTGDMTEAPITIGNEGDEALDFAVGFEIVGEPERGPRRDEPGEVLGQYNSGISSIGGMTSTLDGRIWGCSYSQNRIVSMNVEDGEVLSNFGGPGSPLSIVWQGEELWVCQWSGNVITRYNLDGQALGTFNMGFRQICGMGWDGDANVYMNSLDDRNVHVIQIDNRQQVGLINFRAAAGNADIWGIEWVEHHPDGQLWCNTRNRMYQVAVDDDWQCQAVQNFATNGDQPYVGPGHDGENIWHGMWGNTTWYKRDDGVAEVRWIAVDPTEGQVDPDAEMDVFVLLNANGIAVGEYAAEVMIASNDPENGEVVVDVAMTVVGAPSIRVEWEEDFGFPDVMDWNLLHPEIFAGGPYEFDFVVGNAGSELLIISDLFIENANFTIPFEDDIEIEPGAEVGLTATFDSDESGEYNGELVITWNDPDEEDFIVALQAQSFSAPIIIVDPQAIEEELLVGAQLESAIMIANEGEADLNWAAGWEVIGEPEVDLGQRTVRRTSGQVGPRRDPLDEGMIDGMRFAVFTTNSVWGWLDQGMRQDPLLNNENFVSYRGANHPAEVDFEEYDAIAFSLYNQQFMNAYNANMERLTEYVDGGGGLYFETGNTQGHRSPGGITNDVNGGSSNGQLLVSPDPNHDNYSYLAEVFHASEPNFWNIGEIIEGSSWLHSRYSHAQFENGVENGTLEWFQAIASLQNQPEQWGAVAYGIGGGTVLTVGHPVGHCWFNWARDGGQWGSMAAEILYYLATAGAPAWFAYEPTEGMLAQDEDTEIFVLINAEGLVGGVYEGELTIESNDPANPEIIVSVAIDVIGAPDILVEWEEDDGFPDALDWNMAYDELFADGPYDIIVELSNVGSDPLTIEDVVSDNGNFTTAFEGAFEIPVGETVETAVTFNSEEPGEYAGVITIFCDDPDEAELAFNMAAVSSSPPSIFVEPNAIEAALLTGEIEEHIVNVANEGEAVLNGTIELEVIDNERDVASRSVRSTSTERTLNRDRRGEPDQGDVEWRDNDEGDGPEYEWIDISEIGQRLQPGDDWNSGPLAFGFEFPWYGQVYNSVNACSNGWVSLNPNDRQGTINLPQCPNGGAPNPAFCVLNYDLNPSRGGEMRFWTNENDMAVVSYIRTPNYSNNNITTTFQVIFYESGLVKYQYDELNGHNGNQANVGYEAPNGQIGASISYRVGDYLMAGRAIGIGTADAFSNWITIDQDAFSLEQDEDFDLMVTLNADGMNGGNYSAEIIISSNDPDDPEVVVDVALEVTGAPFLGLEWGGGFDEGVMDWNEEFGLVFTGGPYEFVYEITNTGTELLIISDIFCENEVFMTDFEDDIEVEIGETIQRTITFDAPVDAPGDYNEVVVFVWNHPDGADSEVPLHCLAQLPPSIVVDPNAIEEEMFVGSSLEPVIMLGNDGDADLIWNAEAEVVGEPEEDDLNRSVRGINRNAGPRRDDFGDLLGQYVWNNAPVNRYKNCAYDMDNELMWLGTYSPNWISAISFNDDYDEFAVEVDAFNPAGNPMDMGWINGILYVIPWANNFLLKIDAEGNNLGNCPTPRRMCGVAASHDMELLMLMDDGPREIHIFEIGDDGNLAGNEIAVIRNHRQFMNNQWCRNVEWVDAHPDGQLWIHSPNALWQIHVDDDWQATGMVQNLQNWGGNQEWGGVAHDGTNIWHGGYNRNNYIIIDDATAEMNWFAFEPEAGVVGAGDEGEIFVYINGIGMIEGMYEAELTIFSNDPANPEVVVGVTIEAIGAPAIFVEWEEDYGYPDVLDWNEAYIEIFHGGPYSVPVTIMNVGTEILLIEDFISDNDYFSADFEQEFEIEIGEEVVVDFVFNADEPGNYDAVMTIISDDPDDQEVDIEMHALAQNPPIIWVEPDAIEDDLVTGEMSEHIITMGNDGEANLRGEIDIEIIAEPEVDEIGRTVRSVNEQVGPRRDEVDLGGMMFALLQDTRGWNWLDETMIDRDPLLARNGEDANVVSFRNGDAWNDIDFEEYDAIIYAGSRQSGNFNNAFNANIERLMDYIDGGGGVYTETADMNAPIRLPGGFNNDARGNSNGTLVVSPDPNADNYSLFAEICHESQPNNWEEGERIEGNSWLHSSYNQGQFQAALDEGDIEWFQTIAVPEGSQTAGAIAYGIGSGTVLAVGHPLGHCWTNWVQDGQWGSIGSEILYYLVLAGGPAWITIDIAEFDLAQDNDMDIGVLLNAEGLYGGVYEADLIFTSNDPGNPEVIVTVVLDVTGVPVLEPEWDPGFPEVVDWNEAYIDVFSGGPYMVPIDMNNAGTDLLIIEDVISDHDYFMPQFEDVVEIEAGESAVLEVIFNAPADDPGNYDAILTFISNTPDGELDVDMHAECSLPPIFVWEPDAIEDDLLTDETSEFTITIANDGDALLRWYTEIERFEPGDERDAQSRNVRSVDSNVGPLRDDPGDLIAEFNVPNGGGNQYNSGLAWDSDNEWMWITQWSNPWRVVAIDPNDDFASPAAFNAPGGCMNADYYNGTIYIVNWASRWLFRFNAEGQNLGNLNTPIQPTAMSINQEEGWLMLMDAGGNRDIIIYDLENDMQVIGRINTYRNMLQNNWSRSFKWIQEHPDGQLWMNTRHNGNVAWQIAVDEDNFECIEVVQSFQTFAGNPQEWDGIGHDGENLWATSYGAAQCRIFDDGMAELRWITYDPQEGTVEPDNEDDIFVILDATGLIGGVYEADLTFFTNDPANPEVTINIMLDVTGVPRVEPEWGPGYPDVVDWNEAYPELYTGGGYPIEVAVMNVGTDLLIVEDIFCENGEFTAEPAEFEVEAGEEQIVTFTLFGEDDGDHDGVMVIMSNDPDEVHEIPLRGETLPPPGIEVDPLEIMTELMEGDVEEHVINVTNIGQSELHYWVDAEVIAEPERDAPGRQMRSVSGNIGPRRDPLEEGMLDGMMFAVFETNSSWGWVSDGMMRDPLLNQDNFHFYRGANDPAEVDFKEYDAIAFNLYNQQFMNAYNANMERLTEYVDGGGGLYYETGNTQGHRSPGGITNDSNGGSSNGTFLVSPDPNHENYSYLAEVFNASEPDFWQIGERIEGSSWLHSKYTHGQFENGVENGTLSWFQPIASLENQPEQWGCVAYGIGGGTVLTVGHPSGHCWANWARDGGQWGSMASEILYYLGTAGGPGWLTFDPDEGFIDPDGDEDIIVILNTEGLFGGLYEAEMYIFSNDPVEVDDVPDVIVSISMEVTGQGRIEVNPGGPELEPVDFGIVYIDYPETFVTMLNNVGTDVLTVEGFETDNDAFYVSEDVEFPIDVPTEESFDLPLVFAPAEDAEGQEGTILLITNDAGWEEGYPVSVGGDGLVRPEFFIEPDEIDIAMAPDEIEETVLTVSNEGGSPLSIDSFFDVISEPEPERDNRGRSVRRITSGPVAELSNYEANVDLTPPASVVDNAPEVVDYEQHDLGPVRDEPNELAILLIKGDGDQYGWFDRNSWLEVFEDQDPAPDRVNISQIGDIDLSDYDLVASGEDQTAQFFQSFMQNREQLEEYVDGGGLLSMFCGSNSFQAIQLFSNEGDVAVAAGPHGDWGDVNADFVNDDGDGLIEGIEEDFPILTPFEYFRDDQGSADRVRIRMRGNSLNYAIVQQAALPEDAVWYYRPEQQQNTAIIADWPYGRGYVLFTGITGTLFYEQNWLWSSMMECVNLTRWADAAASARWFAWEPQDGTLQPDEDMDIICTINTTDLIEGIYQGVLGFETNDPENNLFEVDVTVAIGVEPPVMITDVEAYAFELDVEDDPASESFMIGAEEGEDRVNLDFSIEFSEGEWASVDPAEGSIEPGADVEVTLTVDPAGLDHGTEYVTTMTINSNDPDNNEVSVNVTLTTAPDIRIITLDLGQNWNMISINVDPEQFYADDEDRGPDVVEMFEGLRNDEGDHRVILLKNEDGLFYAPAWGFNNIPFWNLTEGYQVNLVEAIEYDIEGAPIAADADIPLEPLWNLVAYFPTYDLDASSPDFYVLADIIDLVFLAKDNNGRFMSPRFNFSNMAPWTEGQGYQVKIQGEDDVMFNYPPAQEEVAFAHRESDSEKHWIAPAPTGDNMSVLITSISGIEVRDGDQIVAHNSRGIVIGAGNVIDGRAGMAVWGDDESSEAVEGAITGEAFTLTIWDADRQAEVSLEVAVIHEGTGLVYGTDAFTALDVNVQSVIPEEYYLAQNYPNPFNSTTRIAFGLPEAAQISVSLYDISGRLVTELVNGTVNAGNHTLVWDANAAPAGIYMVRMEADNGFKSIRKVMLVK